MARNSEQFEVLLTAGAERDLESLYDYIAAHDSTARANHLLDRLMHVVDTRSRFPAHGAIPAELSELGIREFRQLYFKPYRAIYRTMERRVVLYVIADGRRQMQSLLARRLLEH